MRQHFEVALDNVAHHGDTDIFPFPIENHVFFDQRADALALLEQVHAKFFDWINVYPPAHETSLSPVSYTGFRWASQLDPGWNLYFLSLVISLGDAIETARLPTSSQTIFSYRFKQSPETGDIFDPTVGWRQFMDRSIQLAQEQEHSHVVVCDISEFYPRLNHHRLENALLQLGCRDDTPKRIMEFLRNFSNTYSLGLPIGGPAARLLSELVLNQVDRLLAQAGIRFCRFADDYHLFAPNLERAYADLIFLSDKLFTNQTLSLQKSKTRIMTSSEFAAANPFGTGGAAVESEPAPTTTRDATALLRFSIRFDPYSPTAHQDYETLKEELARIDIVGLLKAELGKSRIHMALGKKIVGALRFLEPGTKNGAVLSLLENPFLLYPIWPNVMRAIRILFDDLNQATKEKVIAVIRKLIADRSHVMGVDLNLAYSIRVLGCMHSPENIDLLGRLYAEKTSALIRRDIILIMAKWHNWYWISDLRTKFRSFAPSERRAFIVASYVLRDEGKHWRDHLRAEFTPLEELVRKWASAKAQIAGWSVPI